MKKTISVILSALLLMPLAFMITASAWDTPELMLAAEYNEKKKTITVEYRVLKFAGTESADFRLKFNPDVVEYESAEEKKISSDTMTEIGKQSSDTIAIQFLDMYYVKEEDCGEDGGATVATLTFKVKDGSADSAVFISTADSCNMDPDSKEVTLDRATLKVPLGGGSTSVATAEGYFSAKSESSASQTETDKIKKVVTAAIAATVIFVVLLAVTVIHYRKTGDAKQTNKQEKKK